MSRLNNEGEGTDRISLSIPALPEYVQVVRLIAAGLASRVGFTVDEIEDLRIGVDELTAYLTGTQGREGTLEIGFGLGADTLEITGVAELSPGQRVRSDLTELSGLILGAVCDTAVLEMRDGKPTFHLTKTKRSG